MHRSRGNGQFSCPFPNAAGTKNVHNNQQPFTRQNLFNRAKTTTNSWPCTFQNMNNTPVGFSKRTESKKSFRESRNLFSKNAHNHESGKMNYNLSKQNTHPFARSGGQFDYNKHLQHHVTQTDQNKVPRGPLNFGQFHQNEVTNNPYLAKSRMLHQGQVMLQSSSVGKDGQYSQTNYGQSFNSNERSNAAYKPATGSTNSSTIPFSKHSDSVGKYADSQSKTTGLVRGLSDLHEKRKPIINSQLTVLDATKGKDPEVHEILDDHNTIVGDDSHMKQGMRNKNYYGQRNTTFTNASGINNKTKLGVSEIENQNAMKTCKDNEVQFKPIRFETKFVNDIPCKVTTSDTQRLNPFENTGPKCIKSTSLSTTSKSASSKGSDNENIKRSKCSGSIEGVNQDAQMLLASAKRLDNTTAKMTDVKEIGKESLDPKEVGCYTSDTWPVANKDNRLKERHVEDSSKSFQIGYGKNKPFCPENEMFGFQSNNNVTENLDSSTNCSNENKIGECFGKVEEGVQLCKNGSARHGRLPFSPIQPASLPPKSKRVKFVDDVFAIEEDGTVSKTKLDDSKPYRENMVKYEKRRKLMKAKNKKKSESSLKQKLEMEAKAFIKPGKSVTMLKGFKIPKCKKEGTSLDNLTTDLALLKTTAIKEDESLDNLTSYYESEKTNVVENGKMVKAEQTSAITPGLIKKEEIKHKKNDLKDSVKQVRKDDNHLTCSGKRPQKRKLDIPNNIVPVTNPLPKKKYCVEPEMKEQSNLVKSETKEQNNSDGDKLKKTGKTSIDKTVRKCQQSSSKVKKNQSTDSHNKLKHSDEKVTIPKEKNTIKLKMIKSKENVWKSLKEDLSTVQKAKENIIESKKLDQSSKTVDQVNIVQLKTPCLMEPVHQTVVSKENANYKNRAKIDGERKKTNHGSQKETKDLLEKSVTEVRKDCKQLQTMFHDTENYDVGKLFLIESKKKRKAKSKKENKSSKTKLLKVDAEAKIFSNNGTPIENERQNSSVKDSDLKGNVESLCISNKRPINSLKIDAVDPTSSVNHNQKSKEEVTSCSKDREEKDPIPVENKYKHKEFHKTVSAQMKFEENTKNVGSNYLSKVNLLGKKSLGYIVPSNNKKSLKSDKLDSNIPKDALENKAEKLQSPDKVKQKTYEKNIGEKRLSCSKNEFGKQPASVKDKSQGKEYQKTISKSEENKVAGGEKKTNAGKVNLLEKKSLGYTAPSVPKRIAHSGKMDTTIIKDALDHSKVEILEKKTLGCTAPSSKKSVHTDKIDTQIVQALLDHTSQKTTKPLKIDVDDNKNLDETRQKSNGNNMCIREKGLCKGREEKQVPKVKNKSQQKENHNTTSLDTKHSENKEADAERKTPLRKVNLLEKKSLEYDAPSNNKKSVHPDIPNPSCLEVELNEQFKQDEEKVSVSLPEIVSKKIKELRAQAEMLENAFKGNTTSGTWNVNQDYCNRSRLDGDRVTSYLSRDLVKPSKADLTENVMSDSKTTDTPNITGFPIPVLNTRTEIDGTEDEDNDFEADEMGSGPYLKDFSLPEHNKNKNMNKVKISDRSTVHAEKMLVKDEIQGNGGQCHNEETSCPNSELIPFSGNLVKNTKNDANETPDKSSDSRSNLPWEEIFPVPQQHLRLRDSVERSNTENGSETFEGHVQNTQGGNVPLMTVPYSTPNSAPFHPDWAGSQRMNPHSISMGSEKPLTAYPIAYPYPGHTCYPMPNVNNPYFGNNCISTTQFSSTAPHQYRNEVMPYNNGANFTPYNQPNPYMFQSNQSQFQPKYSFLNHYEVPGKPNYLAPNQLYYRDGSTNPFENRPMPTGYTGLNVLPAHPQHVPGGHISTNSHTENWWNSQNANVPYMGVSFTREHEKQTSFYVQSVVVQQKTVNSTCNINENHRSDGIQLMHNGEYGQLNTGQSTNAGQEFRQENAGHCTNSSQEFGQMNTGHREGAVESTQGSRQDVHFNAHFENEKTDNQVENEIEKSICNKNLKKSKKSKQQKNNVSSPLEMHNGEGSVVSQLSKSNSSQITCNSKQGYENIYTKTAETKAIEKKLKKCPQGTFPNIDVVKQVSMTSEKPQPSEAKHFSKNSWNSKLVPLPETIPSSKTVQASDITRLPDENANQKKEVVKIPEPESLKSIVTTGNQRCSHNLRDVFLDCNTDEQEKLRTRYPLVTLSPLKMTNDLEEMVDQYISDNIHIFNTSPIPNLQSSLFSSSPVPCIGTPVVGRNSSSPPVLSPIGFPNNLDEKRSEIQVKGLKKKRKTRSRTKSKNLISILPSRQFDREKTLFKSAETFLGEDFLKKSTRKRNKTGTSDHKYRKECSDSKTKKETQQDYESEKKNVEGAVCLEVTPTGKKGQEEKLSVCRKSEEGVQEVDKDIEKTTPVTQLHSEPIKTLQSKMSKIEFNVKEPSKIKSSLVTENNDNDCFLGNKKTYSKGVELEKEKSYDGNKGRKVKTLDSNSSIISEACLSKSDSTKTNNFKIMMASACKLDGTCNIGNTTADSTCCQTGIKITKSKKGIKSKRSLNADPESVTTKQMKMEDTTVVKNKVKKDNSAGIEKMKQDLKMDNMTASKKKVKNENSAGSESKKQNQKMDDMTFIKEKVKNEKSAKMKKKKPDPKMVVSEHIKTFQQKIEDPKMKTTETSKRRGSVQKENCPMCSKSFATKKNLVAHITISHPYRCKWCKVEFRSKEESKDHYFTHMKTTFNCKTCHIKYGNATTYNQHLKSRKHKKMVKKCHGDLECIGQKKPSQPDQTLDQKLSVNQSSAFEIETVKDPTGYPAPGDDISQFYMNLEQGNQMAWCNVNVSDNTVELQYGQPSYVSMMDSTCGDELVPTLQASVDQNNNYAGSYLLNGSGVPLQSNQEVKGVGLEMAENANTFSENGKTYTKMADVRTVKSECENQSLAGSSNCYMEMSQENFGIIEPAMETSPLCRIANSFSLSN